MARARRAARRRGGGSGELPQAARCRDRRARHGRRPPPRRQGSRRRVPARVLQAGARPDAGARRALRGEPAHARPPARVRADETKTLDLALFVNGIPVATAELKNPLTDQSVEHAKAQYRRDRDPANVTLARRARRPLRGRSRAGRDDDEARGRGDAVPAVQPRLRGRAARATRPTRTATAPPTCGSRSGSATPGSTCSPASCTSSRPEKGSPAEQAGEDADRSSRASTSGTRCASSRRTRASTAPGASYLVAALGRLGQVEHDRLARASALEPPRRGRPEGVRQGRRDHRPGRARPPAAGDDLPVRARHGVVVRIDEDSHAARRRARGRAGADHHHDAAEVPVRRSTSRGAPGAAGTR